MAALNLNKVIIAGRLTADPELKQTTSGISVTSFTIAINRRGKSDGEQQADFPSIIAWRQTAEFITQYFRKGSSICITGRLQTRSWTDQNGQKRYATEVIAEEASFVDSKTDSRPPETFEKATPSVYHSGPETGFSSNYEDLGPDDDLPF